MTGATGSGFPVCLVCRRRLNDPAYPITSKDFSGDCAECASEYDDDAAKWVEKIRRGRIRRRGILPAGLPDLETTEALQRWLKR